MGASPPVNEYQALDDKRPSEVQHEVPVSIQLDVKLHPLISGTEDIPTDSPEDPSDTL